MIIRVFVRRCRVVGAMEKRKAEQIDGVSKRQRATSPTPLLRLLKQAEQCSLPYGASYYVCCIRLPKTP